MITITFHPYNSIIMINHFIKRAFIISMFIGLLFVSCKEKNNKKEDLQTIPEQQKTKEVKEISQKQSLQEVKKYLKDGIWVSKEFEKSIDKTHSRSVTNFSLTTYTEIIFDGKNTLYCNMPNYMEETPHPLHQDLSAGIGETKDFEIVKVNDFLLTIKDKKDKKHDYFKLKRKYQWNEIYRIIREEGSEKIFYKWFSGKYVFKINSNETIIDFDDKASNYNVSVYYPDEGGETFDLIEFFYKGRQRLYKIYKVDQTNYYLDELEEFLDVDGPIVSKNNKGILTKIVTKTN